MVIHNGVDLSDRLDKGLGRPVCSAELDSSSKARYEAAREKALDCVLKELAKISPDIADKMYDQVSTAVLELCLNAAKYGNQFGYGTKVQLEIYLSGTRLSVVVKDQGNGVPADRLADIVEDSVEPEELSTDEALRRIDTSTWDIPLEMQLPEDHSDEDVLNLKSSGVGLYILKSFPSYAGMYARDGVGEVRIDFDISKA